MNSIQFGLGVKYDDGRNNLVDTNGKVTVEVHSSESPSNSLWYHIGQPLESTVKSTGSKEFSEGKNPSVGINNSGLVVETYETSSLLPWNDHLYYKVGQLKDNTIDWDSDSPEKGDLTVFDDYSNTMNYNTMSGDQLSKSTAFRGKCDKNPSIPCDLFLLSRTLTPPTNVWTVSKVANRNLGDAMSRLSPNREGFIPNILYLDYLEYALPVAISRFMTARFNRITLP